jgi:hypothetical protein
LFIENLEMPTSKKPRKPYRPLRIVPGHRKPGPDEAMLVFEPLFRLFDQLQTGYVNDLSGKPIMAVLHEESTAVGVLRNTQAGVVLDFAGEAGVANICDKFPQSFSAFRQFAAEFDPRRVDMEAFERYSAREVTRSLALLLDQVSAGGSDQAGK